MPKREPDEEITSIEITGNLDRQAVEAIRLEVRRLARRHSVEVRESRREATGS